MFGSLSSSCRACASRFACAAHVSCTAVRDQEFDSVLILAKIDFLNIQNVMWMIRLVGKLQTCQEIMLA